MNHWKKNYIQALKVATNIKTDKISLLLGFNVNIDKIIEVTPTNIEKLIKDLDIKLDGMRVYFPQILNTKSDLVKSLITSITKGIGAERLIKSKDLGKWIENTIPSIKEQIGGQAGIMANLATTVLKVGSVCLHIPIISKELIKLLNNNIRIPLNEKRVERISQIDSFSLEDPPVHYIFEFKKGIYIIKGKKLQCPRDNRFIGSYDLVNSRILLNSAFVEYSSENAEKFDLAIISGLHLLNINIHGLTLEQALNPVIDLIGKWKQKNPKIMIHLELASTSDENLIRYIVHRLFPIVDSIGLNNEELKMTLKALKQQKTKTNGNHTIIDVYAGIKYIWDRYPNLRIHLHEYGYYMVASKNTKLKLAKNRVIALLIAAIGAAIKAQHGEICTLAKFSSGELKSFPGLRELVLLENYLKKENFKGDFQKEGIMYKSDFLLVCVPTVLIEKPVQLVGLGDTISMLALVFEKLL